MTNTEQTIHILIAQERRDIRRYTWLLLFNWRATRGERERWKALRAYHEGQIDRLKGLPHE